jgi:hypothetical protein
MASTPPAAAAPHALLPGDPVPFFSGPTVGGKGDFHFSTLGGRTIVLTTLGDPARPAVRALLGALRLNAGGFDDVAACWFGVATHTEGDRAGLLVPRVPGLRVFADADGAIHALFGADPAASPRTLIIDHGFRLRARITEPDPLSHVRALLDALAAVPPLPVDGPARGNAPILVVPDIFEPALCRQLIDLYEAGAPERSGFMRSNPEGQTIYVVDDSHKVRRDVLVEDARLKSVLRERIARRLAPQIAKAFQFHATRLERYLVGCYTADDAGHFNRHRDNTTKGTAHRRFAVSIGLDAEGYDGGDLRFPEFDLRCHRPPTGGAVVFSCSLLHEVLPVTRGKRYAFLPFLFDESAEQVRQANLRYVVPPAA